MERLVKRVQDRLPSDHGAVLPLVVLILVVLIGMAAFATDLGWMYVNSARVQRAAEAAALSSVVELPADITSANAVALSVAGNNGYVPDLDTFVVTDPQPDGYETRMRVEITDTIPLFFLRVFGMDAQAITREATAEYLPPLPLGSPSGQFGNSCDPNEPGCSGQVNFWANIHGRDTDTRMGDAYSSRCAAGTGSGSSTCPVNPDYRDTGYLYGIEAGAGSFTVEFNDLEFHWDSPAQVTGDDIRTGDRGCEDWGPAGPGQCGPNMIVNLYAPDATPLDISDNALICSTTVGRLPQVVESDPYGFTSPAGCLTVGSPLAGIYVLQIRIGPPGAGDNSGLNRYSLRATGGARLYGIGDISIYNNANGTTSLIDLAEILDIYRGKTFVVELYDPGEVAGGGTISIIDPTGNPYPSCRMSTRPSGGSSWTSQGTRTPCSFFAINNGGANDYNGDWVKLEMDLSDTYSCGTCWWHVQYAFGTDPNDTTTWRAYVVGAPVHVVPNG
jgi:hypothetical protein